MYMSWKFLKFLLVNLLTCKESLHKQHSIVLPLFCELSLISYLCVHVSADNQ